jgi:hypothetical protein
VLEVRSPCDLCRRRHTQLHTFPLILEVQNSRWDLNVAIENFMSSSPIMVSRQPPRAAQPKPAGPGNDNYRSPIKDKVERMIESEPC